MRRIGSESLLALAIKTLRTEIQPVLPAERRYELAMTVRALEIARREIQAESDAATWQLLDTIYDDGEGTLDMLSADIRTGKVSDETHPELRGLLERFLLSELEIRNPRALKQRPRTSSTVQD